jgi:hypothetical protein
MTRQRYSALQEEQIIESGYTLPSPHWRVVQGMEWGSRHTCYLCFHLRRDTETGAYFDVEDAVATAWDMERARA